MIDRSELNLICRARAERLARINTEAHRAFVAPTKPNPLRQSLAHAATWLGAWLDPATASGVAAQQSTRPSLV